MAQTAHPTFLCIGIQKAGTSWLYQMVAQHPEVCVSEPKELHYFNREKNYQRGLGWYLDHFRHAAREQAAGEFTPDYLWFRPNGTDDPAMHPTPDVAARVAGALPELKLIVCLRDPVSRAVSSYFHHIGAGRLSPSRRLSKVGDEWGIRSMGHYADHLEHWLEYFPQERFQILIYEEDLAESVKPDTLSQVFRHLEVDTAFAPQGLDERYNKRRSPFDYRLARLPGRAQRLARRHVPEFIRRLSFWDIPVSQAELDELRDYYRPHNERLEALLDRRLPW